MSFSNSYGNLANLVNYVKVSNPQKENTIVFSVNTIPNLPAITVYSGSWTDWTNWKNNIKINNMNTTKVVWSESEPSKIIIPVDGLYKLEFSTSAISAGAWSMLFVRCPVDITEDQTLFTIQNTNSVDNLKSFTTVYNLNLKAGDVIRISNIMDDANGFLSFGSVALTRIVN